MSRWTEFDGKFVDLDEVRAVELSESEYGAAIVLTVAGGTVSLPILVTDYSSADNPYLVYPTEAQVLRPRFLAFRPAARRAWIAQEAESARVRAEYVKAREVYDDKQYQSRRKQIEDCYEEIVCQVGAKDCEEPA